MTAILAASFLLLQCLCQVLATVVECGSELPSGYVRYPDDNTANKVYTDIVTWNDARRRCHTEGADLAVAVTPQKIRHIHDRSGGQFVWIGIHRPSGRKGGDWVRVDTGLSVPSSSLRWGDYTGSSNYNCALTFSIERISNYPCTQTSLPFACEISLAEGCPGPAGPPGPQGPPGLKGDKGSSGLNGPKGEEGKSGERGSDGSPGAQGEKGSTGDAGASGPQGFTGLTGPAGDRGPIGPSGSQGAKGDPGPPGPGYNATWFALLAACQEQGRGAPLLDGGESASDFGNYNLVEQKCEEFIANAYEQMWISFQNPIALDEVHGEVTAKTCRNLFVAHPDTPSGEYWIDPNGDDDSDKILVHCDAEKRSTCIRPAVNQSQEITYEGKEQEVWLSEHEMGMQITYTADDHQINALQLLSRHAEQKVTYHCLKSVGYFDAEAKTYERGLKLSAWTEVELTPRGRQRLRYDVITDECQNRTNEWRDTVIAYRTSRPVLLPILDVALRDLGEPEKKAIIEVGDVCFS